MYIYIHMDMYIYILTTHIIYVDVFIFIHNTYICINIINTYIYMCIYTKICTHISVVIYLLWLTIVDIVATPAI